MLLSQAAAPQQWKELSYPSLPQSPTRLTRQSPQTFAGIQSCPITHLSAASADEGTAADKHTILDAAAKGAFVLLNMAPAARSLKVVSARAPSLPFSAAIHSSQPTSSELTSNEPSRLQAGLFLCSGRHHAGMCMQHGVQSVMGVPQGHCRAS